MMLKFDEQSADRRGDCQYRALVESVAQAIWETDANGVVTADSPSWRAYTGQTLEEWLGYSWVNAVHPDDRADAKRQWREALVAGRNVDAEFRLCYVKGGYRWTNVRARPLIDEDGRIRKWVGMNIDIDSRKGAEEALRENEQRLAATLQGLRESETRLRALITASAQVLYRMSPDWKEMRQLPGGTFFANTDEPNSDWLQRYIHPDDKEYVLNRVAEAIRTGDPFEFEHRVLRQDGTVGWTLSRAVPVRDAAGSVVEWFGTAADITDRKHAEEELRESERRISETLAIETVGVIYLDPETLNITRANNAFLRMSGFSVEEVQNGAVNSYALTPPEFIERTDDARRELVEKGSATPYEKQYVRRDGSRMWGLFAPKLLGPNEAVEFVLDITDKKNAEQAEHEIQERFRLAVESASDYAIFTTDIHGTITSWPTGAAGVFGYAAEEALGMSFEALFVPSERYAGQPLRELTIAEQQGVTRDIGWHLRKNGEEVFIEGFTRAIRDSNGELTGFLKIGQDVTERRRIEQRLRESEERFRLFVHNVREYALVQTDRSGRITGWNAGAERLFGYSTLEVLGKNMSQLLTLEDRAACVLEDELARVIAGARVEDARWLVRKDGSRFWAHWVTEPIRRESGELRSVAKLIRDETDRMQADRALRESERRFHAVANFIPDLLWESDPDGSTRWYNDRWYQYTGQSAAEADGFGWTAVIHPDDREQSRIRWIDAVKEGAKNFRHEHRIRRADGQYRWFLVQTEPLLDEQGRIVRHFGAATDVHEQRLAMEALGRSEASLRTTLASLSDAIIATDADGRVQFLNSVAEAFTGWPQAEAIGKSIEEVYQLTTLQGGNVLECQVRRSLSRGEIIPPKRFFVYARDGRRIPVEDVASPIVQGNRILGAVSIVSDISEHLRAEAQQADERDQLEKQMHETSKALGYTRAELQTLSRHLMMAQDDERRRVASELHDNFGQRTAVLEFAVERLNECAGGGLPAQLVDTLRSHVRELASGLRDISHRLHPSTLENLGLSAAIRGLVDEHCKSGQDVSFFERGTAATIPADVKTALYRIAQEALRNALKHAADAPVRVLLTCEDSELRLTIEDAGPGFDLKNARAGFGLGLLSMHERARSVAGEMAVESTPGEGTSITVRVPVR